jgi:hypothetical protein
VSLAGIRYSELRLARAGNDLLVKVAGTTDTLRFTGWYAAAGNRTASTLQMIVDSTADYNAGSADALLNRRVVRLNFGSIVSAFDAAYAANPSVGDWAVPSTTLSSARAASSDTDAIGGQLAYRYGRDGNLAGLDFTASQAVMGDTNFATAGQAIGSGATTGGVRLMRAPITTMATDIRIGESEVNQSTLADTATWPLNIRAFAEAQLLQALAPDTEPTMEPEPAETATPAFASIGSTVRNWRGRVAVRRWMVAESMVAIDRWSEVETAMELQTSRRGADILGGEVSQPQWVERSTAHAVPGGDASLMHRQGRGGVHR